MRMPTGWPRVTLCLAGPVRFAPRHVVAEVMETVGAALAQLGATVTVTDDEVSADSFNIVVLPNLVSPELARRLPTDAVLYNFEQIGTPRDNNPVFAQIRGRHILWDYSTENMARLKQAEGHDRMVHVPVGHMRLLERITRLDEPDIDVLFYGAYTDRRLEALASLRRRGINVRAVAGVYGTRRDALLARARLVLNLHAELPAILEETRLSYAMANGVPVLSEFGVQTLGDPFLLQGIATAPFAGLAESAETLLSDAKALADLGCKGQARIRQRDQVSVMAAALQATVALR